MRKLIILLHIPAAVLMIWFAIPKIAGAEVSVKGFDEISRSLPVSADLFRVFTGATEIFIALLFILFVILSFEKLGLLAALKNYRDEISLAGNLLLLATMGGALLAEFFARQTPKYVLVCIAVGLIAFSLTNIFYYFKNKNSFSETI